MSETIELTVLGGLPVTVTYYVDRENGVLEDWVISAVNGRLCKCHPEWIENRLTDNARSDIEEQCIEDAR